MVKTFISVKRRENKLQTERDTSINTTFSTITRVTRSFEILSKLPEINLFSTRIHMLCRRLAAIAFRFKSCRLYVMVLPCILMIRCIKPFVSSLILMGLTSAKMWVYSFFSDTLIILYWVVDNPSL